MIYLYRAIHIQYTVLQCSSVVMYSSCMYTYVSVCVSSNETAEAKKSVPSIGILHLQYKASNFFKMVDCKEEYKCSTQGLNPIFPAGSHKKHFAGKARHFHSIFWQLISLLFKVQCDSKPICAGRAKSRSPGTFPWKSLHTRCATGYCRVLRMLDVQQANTALYITMQKQVSM